MSVLQFLLNLSVRQAAEAVRCRIDFTYALTHRTGRQRTDSTHVLAAACDLTRLELVTEAVRATLEELARETPDLLEGLRSWGGRASQRCSRTRAGHPARQ